jgi:molybdenum cofactor cytidylyltransferase
VVLGIGRFVEDDRHAGLPEEVMGKLHSFAENMRVPLLIEADGSRMRPLKAPAQHEPPIPDFVNLVVVTAGMSAIAKPFSDKIVHRAEIFSNLSGILPGDEITPEAVIKVLCHKSGGLKNIPPNARKVLLLNQADSSTLQKIGNEIAQTALSSYDSVIVASLKTRNISNDVGINLDKLSLPDWYDVHSVHEHIAGIILAAGESRRFGQPKQLLDWNGEPLVRKLAQTALEAGLSKVIVVTGANAGETSAVLEDLPLTNIYNSGWHEGQSSSIRLGIQSIGDHVNAAIFLLADQPFISVDLVQTLAAEHSISMAPIIAPVVQNQRGNPVLFDRKTFPELLKLKGNEGGRTIFDRFSPLYIKWHDPRILLDIDTPEDYLRIKNFINEQI